MENLKKWIRKNAKYKVSFEKYDLLNKLTKERTPAILRIKATNERLNETLPLGTKYNFFDKVRTARYTGWYDVAFKRYLNSKYTLLKWHTEKLGGWPQGKVVGKRRLLLKKHLGSIKKRLLREINTVDDS